MALKEYLKEHGGTKTFYRIQEIYENKLLLHQLGEIDNKTKIAEEIYGTIFVKKPKNINVFVSNKSWYISYGTEYKIADIVTLSLDKTKGRKEFAKALRNSAKIRKNNWAHVNRELRPFFKKLMSSGLVEGIIVRGDLVDPKRFPCKYSDIDIVLLINFKSKNKTAKQQLLKILRKSPGVVGYDYYEVSKKGFRGKTDKLVHRKAAFAVEYDILSLPDIEELVKVWKTEGRKLRKYDISTFSNAKIIFEKSHAAKEFLRMILSLK